MEGGPDPNLVRAVEEVRQASRQAVITESCNHGLRSGSNEDLRAALIKAHDSGRTWVVKDIADQALGLKQKSPFG